MVLMAEIEGRWEPIRSIRSVIWRIPKRKVLKPSDWEGTEYGEYWYPEDQMLEIRIEKCPVCYPKSWYEASNWGYGYRTIKMIENGEIKDYPVTDYERIQNSGREENRKHKMVLINYAVTSGGNVPHDIKISGATKAIIIELNGAASENDANVAARTIGNSPLVKTAVFGQDPNWGRIMAALGRSGVKMEENRVQIWIEGIKIVEGGLMIGKEEEIAAAEKMKKEDVTITINLNQGLYKDKITTCDFTYDYIKINADYRS
jgi:hypothetical protein